MNERLSETTVDETPPRELLGSRALVTGGTRGIGAAIAATLASRGANVVISARAPADEQFPRVLSAPAARPRWSSTSSDG